MPRRKTTRRRVRSSRRMSDLGQPRDASRTMRLFLITCASAVYILGQANAAELRPAWSFRNHIIPTLTKIGCNSGACHGALAGKGGLKLSLRGYAPEIDHFVLTRQAL